ncbi:DUF1772 domain-containing protein [Nocardioides coralli]|nr:DUF1772 domain-containing protein [Nocardioides coralli]
MPGFGRVDDRTFVGAFQAIDRAIINPWFLGGAFFGAPALTLAAALLHLGEGQRSVLWWALGALVAQVVIIAITIVVNVPRNNALKDAGDPDTIDVAAVRRAFDEGRWVRANRVRVLLSVVALAALCWSLVVHGRLAG